MILIYWYMIHYHFLLVYFQYSELCRFIWNRDKIVKFAIVRLCVTHVSVVCVVKTGTNIRILPTKWNDCERWEEKLSRRRVRESGRRVKLTDWHYVLCSAAVIAVFSENYCLLPVHLFANLLSYSHDSKTVKINYGNHNYAYTVIKITSLKQPTEVKQ